jgi:HEAT repeats/Type II secretion system (T2SS), protein E, N-terminal domain
MSLSSLIVQREVATIREVEEALARQVIYGGDLLTNLLEVARLDEGVLTALLAAEHGLDACAMGELPPATDAARNMFPREMAIQRSIAPLAIENDRLVVAVAERLPGEVTEQLAFTLGVAVEQRAALLVRVRQAITAAYGIPLERRMDRLVARLGGAPSSHAASTRPLFEPILPVVEAPRPPSAPPPPVSVPPNPVVMQASMPSHRITSAGFPAPVLPAPPPPVALVAEPPVPVPPAERDSAPKTPVVAQLRPDDEPSRPQLLQRDVVTAPRPARRRRGPLHLEDAKKELEAAEDRDALLDLVFDFARQYFDFSALFIVHADIAEGRDAWGTGASRDRVVGIGVPLDLPSLLSTAREKRTPILARPAADGLDAVLLADLQRPARVELLVVPIVVRTRAVALFLGDPGDHAVEDDVVREIGAFASSVGVAFEKLIVRRKLSGFMAGTSGAATGKVDAALIAPKTKGVPSRASVPVLAPLVAPPPARTPSPPPAAPASPRRFTTPPPFLEALIRSRAASSAPPPPTPAPLLSDIAPAPVTRQSGAPIAYPPPHPNVAVVRRVSGPPIPREEPESSKVPSDPPPASGPHVAAHALDDDAAHALLDEIASSPDSSPGGTYAPNGPPSISIAVAPHRPPTSRSGSVVELPSVMVELQHEFTALVDRVLSDGGDEAAEAELLRQGQGAMPAIMARFPGPVSVERGKVGEALLRPSECGPILKLVAGQRKVALPFVLDLLSGSDGEKRYWATFLLTELHYPEAVQGAIDRLFDSEARTRRAARLALSAISRVSPESVVDHLAKIAKNDEAGVRREVAVAVLGDLREPMSVPVLVHILGDAKGELAAWARKALIVTTRQDFGVDARRWAAWWTTNSTRHRVEWLIDALDHETLEIRRAAGEELKALTKEYFGFADDLPTKERQRSQQRYRDWWVTEGRGRFRRR